MRRRPRIGRLLGSLFQRADPRAEVEAELAFHLARRVEEHEARGLSPDDARAAALRGFGDFERLRDTCHRLATQRNQRMRLRELLTDLRLDTVFALRQLASHRGFAIAAILTLGLGIGANGAVFSVVNAILLRPLPVKDAERLVMIAGTRPTALDPFRISYPDFRDLAAQSTSIEDAAAVLLGIVGVEREGTSDQTLAAYVSHNYFAMLGLAPAHGRLIGGTEDRAGAERSIVLGHSYWQRTFGGDPSAIGRQLRVDGRPFTIVGVAPEGFSGTYALVDMAVYLPLGTATESAPNVSFFDDRGQRDLRVFAHLAPNVSLPSAQAELAVIAANLARAHPTTNREVGVRVFAERDARPEPRMDNQNRVIGGIFLTLVALVLLVACLNVANLLLARATRRRGELGIRAALGASRARLMRQAVTESLVLAIAGGAAGIGFGALGSHLLERIQVPGPLRFSFDLSLDVRSFAFLAILALGSGVVVGVAPAWRAARSNLEGELRAHGRDRSGHGRGPIRTLLVGSQLAGAMVILIIAGLFTRSLAAARTMDLGFQHTQVLDLTLDPAKLGYDEAQGRAFFERLLTKVRSVPGVASAAFAYAPPLGYYGDSTHAIAEGALLDDGESPPVVGVNTVGPGYFETLGIPLHEGRGFDTTETSSSTPVAVINQALAARLWPGDSAIGKRLRLRQGGPLHEVVGVARNGRYRFIFEPQEPHLYLPLAQRYTALRVLHVKSASQPPTALVDSMREAVNAVDGAMPIFEVTPLTTALDGGNGYFLPRFGAVLTTILAALGLILAIIGVYGVIALRTAGRAREIGLRVAMGATPRSIVRLVLSEGFRLAVLGLVFGVIVAVFAARSIASLLFEVSTTDLPTYLAAIAILAVTVLLGSLIPALRALRVDPTVALRDS